MITIKINERTKAGKAILTLAKILSETNKGVIVEKGLASVKEEKKYNKAFITMIKDAEKEIKAGKTKTINPENIWPSLGLK